MVVVVWIVIEDAVAVVVVLSLEVREVLVGCCAVVVVDIVVVVNNIGVEELLGDSVINVVGAGVVTGNEKGVEDDAGDSDIRVDAGVGVSE